MEGSFSKVINLLHIYYVIFKNQIWLDINATNVELLGEYRHFGGERSTRSQRENAKREI